MELFVDQDIEAQYLEHLCVGDVVLVTADMGPIVVIQVGLESDDALLDCVFYLFLYGFDVVPLFLQSLPQGREQSLRASVATIGEEVLLRRFVVFRLFVERKVGQMHEHVLHILRIRLPIVLSAESGQSFVAQVRLNRIEALDQNVETQIEFLLVQENRRLDIPLHQQVRMMVGPQILGYPLELVNQENTLATFSGIGFANEREFGVLLHVGLERASFFGQKEADRRETKLLVKGLPHPVRDGAEHLLPRHVLHQRVPIPIKLIFRDLLEIFVVQC